MGQTVGVFLRLVFIAPLQWLVAFCNFYFQRHGPKDLVKRLSAANVRAEQKESKKVEKRQKHWKQSPQQKLKMLMQREKNPKMRQRKRNPRKMFQKTKNRNQRKPLRKKKQKPKNSRRRMIRRMNLNQPHLLSSPRRTGATSSSSLTASATTLTCVTSSCSWQNFIQQLLTLMSRRSMLTRLT